MNTPTPRTNKAFLDGYTFCKEDMMPAVAFASQLETELTAVTEQRDQWKDKYIQQNKDLGHELRDPNGTIWSECKRLQTELTAARAEIATVTEQREYWANLWADLARECVKDIAKVEREVVTLTQQRNVAAEALDRITNQAAGILCRQIANKALQSLTTNEQ
jgi:hypothetical protein